MVLLPTMRMSATGSSVAESDGPDVSRSSCFLPNIDLGIDGMPPPGMSLRERQRGHARHRGNEHCQGDRNAKMKCALGQVRVPNRLRTVRRGMTLRLVAESAVGQVVALAHAMCTGRAAVSGPNRDAQKPRRNSRMATEQQDRVRRGDSQSAASSSPSKLTTDGSPRAAALLAAEFD